MEVIQILILGYVAYMLFKGGNPWLILAAIAVAVWFPQIGKIVGQAADLVVDLVQTATGRL